jgi:hypothetical protein
MTARTALRSTGVLAILLLALALAFGFTLSAPAAAQDLGESDDGQQEAPEGGTEDGAGEGAEDGAGAEGEAEGGFEAEGDAEAGAEGEFDEGGVEEDQVDAPAGAAEAGFGGLDGDGSLYTVFAVAMATIALIAGGVWFAKARATS